MQALNQLMVWQRLSTFRHVGMLEFKQSIRMGTKDDLSDFEYEMVVSDRWDGLSISENGAMLGFPSHDHLTGFTKNENKRENSQWTSQNMLLMPKVTGQRPDCFNMTVYLNIIADYVHAFMYPSSVHNQRGWVVGRHYVFGHFCLYWIVIWWREQESGRNERGRTCSKGPRVGLKPGPLWHVVACSPTELNYTPAVALLLRLEPRKFSSQKKRWPKVSHYESLIKIPDFTLFLSVYLTFTSYTVL